MSSDPFQTVLSALCVTSIIYFVVMTETTQSAFFSLNTEKLIGINKLKSNENNLNSQCNNAVVHTFGA